MGGKAKQPGVGRGNGQQTAWTPEEDAIIRKAVEDRKSSGECADLIPAKSRNAIVSRAKRLGVRFCAGSNSSKSISWREAIREPAWFTSKTRLRKTQARSIKAAQTKSQKPAPDALEADGPELGRIKSQQFAKPVTLANGYSYHKGVLTRKGV